jgi:ornithine carbamoyltransferase
MISAVSALVGRDFLDIADFQAGDLRRIIDLAHSIKGGRWAAQPLAGKHVVLLFQRPSHRTRVSFEVGISRLGGAITNLGEQDLQLGVRETIGDAARVLDTYVDAIVARLRHHTDLVALAAASQKPVVNALTDRSHPCQVLADLLTLEEVGGPLSKQHVVFVGDGNNIAVSLMEAAARMEFRLTVISPPGYEPDPKIVGAARGLSADGDLLTLTNDLAWIEGASAVYTDVWASMGHEAESEARRRAFAEYQVNAGLMKAAPDAAFMHCLPAHRGEEVTDEVIDGPQSVVFRQAGNRLYAQMALMAELLGGND